MESILKLKGKELFSNDYKLLSEEDTKKFKDILDEESEFCSDEDVYKKIRDEISNTKDWSDKTFRAFIRENFKTIIKLNKLSKGMILIGRTSKFGIDQIEIFKLLEDPSENGWVSVAIIEYNITNKKYNDLGLLTLNVFRYYSVEEIEFTVFEDLYLKVKKQMFEKFDKNFLNKGSK